MNYRKAFVVFAALMMAATASATITSVDQLSFQSSSSFYDGQTIVFEITGNRDTDTIDITLDNQLESKTEGDVQNSVSIKATQTKSKLKYGFRSTGDMPIYKFSPRKFQVDAKVLDKESTIERKIRESGKLSRCFDISRDGSITLGDDYVYKAGFDGFNAVAKVYCVGTENRVGNVGEISSSPSTIWKTRFRVEDASGVHTKTVSNSGDNAGAIRFGENVIIQSNGAYSAGNNAPTPTDEKVMHTNSEYFIHPYTGEKVEVAEGGFTVINEDMYNRYVQSLPNMITKLRSWRDGNYDDVSKTQVVENTNNLAGKASKEFTDSEFTSGDFSGNSFTGGTLTLDVPNLVFPKYTGYAKVCRSLDGSCDAAVQIKKTVGEPKIVSTSGATVTELNTGYVSATVKNVGNAEGQFTASIKSCSTGFSSLGSSRTFSLNEGSKTQVKFPVSFSSTSSETKKQSGSCTFQLTEKNLGTSVTSQVQVKGKQANECTPGETYRKVVDGKYAVFQCTENGLDNRKILQCNKGEIASRVKGEYKCLDSEEVDDPIVDKIGECETKMFGTVVGNPLCKAQKGFSGMKWGLGTAVMLLEWASGLVAFVYGLGLGQQYLAPITRKFTEIANIPVGGDKVTLLTGLLSGTFLGLIVFSLASSLVVKVVVFLGLLLAIYIQVGIEAAIPG